MVKHELNIGITRSGKTYNAFEQVKHSSAPSIYYNIKKQPIEVVKKYIEVDASITQRQLYHAMKHYKLINFIPSDSAAHRKHEIAGIVKLAFAYGGPVNLIWDEAWEYIPQNTQESPVFTVARRGASEGIKNIILSQSPADIDKKAVKQCEIIRVFRLNEWDYRYLKTVGFDGEKINLMLESAPQYSHVLLANGKMELIKPGAS